MHTSSKDIGKMSEQLIPLWEANMDLINSKNELDLNDDSWKIFTQRIQLCFLSMLARQQRLKEHLSTRDV